MQENGKVAAYINCDNGKWFAQATKPTDKAPHFYEVTGERVYMIRTDAMQESVVAEKLGL